MTDNRIEKIRAEIERRYNEYMAKDSELAAIRADECLGILSYIDSMQEEPTIPDIVDEHFWEMLGEEPVSEELEEEMESFFIKMQVQENENIFEDTFKNIARHFAKWQKKKDAEAINENALLYNARLEGVEIGKAEMKQQMMKNAVTAEVRMVEYFMGTTTFRCICDKYKIGDKVKLIIIKEDEQ